MVPKQKKLSLGFLGEHLSTVRRLQYAFRRQSTHSYCFGTRKTRAFSGTIKREALVLRSSGSRGGPLNPHRGEICLLHDSEAHFAFGFCACFRLYDTKMSLLSRRWEKYREDIWPLNSELNSINPCVRSFAGPSYDRSCDAAGWGFCDSRLHKFNRTDDCLSGQHSGVPRLF